MSGLLPRVTPTQQTGNFSTVRTNNLDVSGLAFINSLTTNTLSIDDLTVNSVTTPLINGTPDLNLTGTVTVNSSTILTANDTITLTNKTIDSSNNTITITNSPLAATNVNSLINQDVRTSASPTFVDATLTGVANDNTIVNVLGINGSNVIKYKNNLADTSTIQTFTNKNIKVPSCKLVDNSDATIAINFLTSGSTTGTNTQLTFAQSSNRVVTFPDATYNIVGDTTTQTLTNKTLQAAFYWDGTGETIQFITAGLTGPRNITIPDSDGILTYTGLTQTLSNKTLDSSCVAAGSGLSACNYSSNIVSNFPVTFDTTALTAPRSMAWPDGAGTVVVSGAPQTLTNKTIDSASNTIEVSGTNINTLINQDVRTTAAPTWNTINVNQISGTPLVLDGTNWQSFVTTVNTDLGQNVSPSSSPSFTGLSLTGIANDNTITNIIGINGSNVVKYKNNLLDTSSIQTLTNKSLVDASTSIVDAVDATKKILFDAGGTTTTTSTITGAQTANRVLTLPDATCTLTGTTNTATLTNKTLDSASNTLTITNSPLSAVNVNSLINQDVRTSAGPTFTDHVNITQTSASSFTVTGKFDLGYSNSVGAYFSSSAVGDTDLRNQDNTKALNLGVGANTAQLQIMNTAIVGTCAFNMSLSGNTVSSDTPVRASNATGVTTTLLTIATTSNTSGMIRLSLAYNKLVGTVQGYGSTSIADFAYVNNAGTVTTTADTSNKNTEANIAGVFLLGTTFALAVSGTNVLVNVSNSFADNAVKVAGTINIRYSV